MKLKEQAGTESHSLGWNSGIAVKGGTGFLKAHQATDSTPAYSHLDFATLRSRFARDGYLLIRGLIPQIQVTQVRHYTSLPGDMLRESA